MCSLRYLNGRTPSPFPAEAGHVAHLNAHLRPLLERVLPLLPLSTKISSNRVRDLFVFKAWLERELLWEERLAAIQNYYLGEREKEEQAADRVRREKCARIGNEIARAAARAERAELIRRGVYR